MVELRPRLMRAVDFTAETLDAEANRMPLTYKTQADALREMAATLRKSDNPKMIRVWEEEPDYRIGQDDTTVTFVSERATQRVTGPRPEQGWKLAFKTKYETAEFVRAGESDGFTFEGKEHLAGVP